MSEGDEARDKKSEDVRTKIERMAKNEPTLTSVLLSWCDLTDAHAAEIGSALRKNTHVARLHLRENNIGGDGARALAEALLSHNSSLSQLRLSRNDIGVKGAGALAAAISSRSNSSRLSELHLPSNDIGDDGAIMFAGALARNNTLTTLNLRCNDIGEDGLRALANALCANGTLTKLCVDARSDKERAVKAKIERLLKCNKREKELIEMWRGMDFLSSVCPVLLCAAGKFCGLRGVYKLFQRRPDILRGGG